MLQNISLRFEGMEVRSQERLVLNQGVVTVWTAPLSGSHRGRHSEETPGGPSFEVPWAKLFLRQSRCSRKASFVGSEL